MGRFGLIVSRASVPATGAAAAKRSDNSAVDPLAKRLALVRPGVLMCDHDRDATRPAKQRAPNVRAELVRVHDVEPAAVKQGGEATHRKQIPSRAPTQRDVRYGSGVKNLGERSWSEGSCRADGDLEPLAR